ncbi:hypothetical protein I3U51_06005 [Mycobacteroides abscessus subsp. abscessus]|nr:hypothetical protein [Mycobacteroides abscessus]MBN7440067.1 hypothetical protein [Mycobacteroides abscessus subsp. abscessus]
MIVLPNPALIGTRLSAWLLSLAGVSWLSARWLRCITCIAVVTTLRL